MNSSDIRDKFLKFFESRGHKIVHSASLVPENDPSVLFTTAGMQQFKPYYTGDKDAERDFGSKNTTSVQKCVRTSDIEEVGDDTHLTFFEMLGNFSFGGYGRKEAIIYAHDFITKELGLEISFVTFYEGSENVPKDEESKKVWEDLGVKSIKESGDDVFWGPTGNSGPCGPTTEIYCRNSEGEDVEIWNIVFNEYFCDGSREDLNNGKAKLTKLPILGIDTGMGLERLVMIKQRVSNVFETDVLKLIITKIKEKYSNLSDERAMRIVADHVRNSVFLIADGVLPSNSGQGYILRRLLRRAIFQADKFAPGFSNLYPLVDVVISQYGEIYPNLEMNKKIIHEVFETEEIKFQQTIKEGLKYLEKGEDPFVLFSTYGFPFELTKELSLERGITVDEKAFQEKFKEHQDLSRTGAEQKFKGGLLDTSEMSVKYHTATHLLHQALRDVLGTEVSQKGSNITPERLRFDFVFSRKMTEEEKSLVEDMVNKKIQESLPVQNVILPKNEAEASGALHFFDQKYPDQVSVYYIGDDLTSAYSKEFCGGPHVSNTSELGKFKIVKEESVSLGVRRIKAVLE